MARSHRLTTIGLALLTTTSVVIGLAAAPAQAATTGVVSVYKTTKVRYKAATGKQNKIVITRAGNTCSTAARAATASTAATATTSSKATTAIAAPPSARVSPPTSCWAAPASTPSTTSPRTSR